MAGVTAAHELDPSTTRPSRNLLVAAVACVLIWGVALVWMAVTSANPVTLNFEQIAQSTLVVAGHLSESDATEFVVSEVWPEGTVPLGPIRIENADLAQLPAGQELLVPLIVLKTGDFEITRAKLPLRRSERTSELSPPYVYPDRADTREQLHRILTPRGE